MTQKYYARAWVRGGEVCTVQTCDIPILADAFLEWSDQIIDFEVDGGFEFASDLLSKTAYGPDGLFVVGRSFTLKGTRPGIPRDVEAELAEERARMKLSFAQLLIGLVAEEWITQAEGTAWLVDRTPPAQVTALIGALPAEQQFAALARAVAPSEVLRLDPLVVGMGQAAEKTAEELDVFFRTYRDV